MDTGICLYELTAEHARNFSVVECVSIRKSKIGFFNPNESENGFCVSLLNREIQHPTNHFASMIPLTHYDPRDLELISLAKKRKIRVRILSDFGFCQRNSLLDK